MNEYISYCGLDCEACEARLATVNNDDVMRQRIAREWSDLNGVEITPEMINCSGCRIPGAKTPYCDSLCPIRKCAMGKQMETCSGCTEMNSCEKLAMITGNNADALRRLKMEKPMVELRAITEENFIDAFNLKLAPGQEKFVSHPIRSLAQAYVYRNQCQPFGIYVKDKMIGYVMVIYDNDIPEYDIWHMMIDESVQGKGCGGEALDRVIDYVRTKPFGDSGRVALTCNKNNPIARKLYESRGFSATGIEDEDEIELAMMIR